jgi:hypothetical protein
VLVLVSLCAFHGSRPILPFISSKCMTHHAYELLSHVPSSPLLFSWYTYIHLFK